NGSTSSQQPGPVIVVEFNGSSSSGHHAISRVIARVFPRFRSHAEGDLHDFHFPIGPYPSDRLTYKNARMVEYETPAGAEGLGFDLAGTGEVPIRGVA